MKAVIKSELTKILTSRTVWLVSLALILLAVLGNYGALVHWLEKFATVDGNGMLHWYTQPTDATLEFFGDSVSPIFIPGLIFPLLGAVIAGSEFQNSQLGVSLLAVPSRSKLIVGKIIATIMYTIGLGLILNTMTLFTSYLGIRSWKPELIFSYAVLIQHLRAMSFLIIATLLGLAITIIVRRTLWGVLIMGGFLVIFQTRILASFSFLLDALTPISAMRNFLLQVSAHEEFGVGIPYTSSPLVGGIVTIGWVIAVLWLSIVLMKRRDAR